MSDKYTRNKIKVLVERITKSEASDSTILLIELRGQRIQIPNRAKVRTLLAESLNRSEDDVVVKLASYNDSDRILDDIVSFLNSDD